MTWLNIVLTTYLEDIFIKREELLLKTNVKIHRTASQHHDTLIGKILH